MFLWCYDSQMSFVCFLDLSSSSHENLSWLAGDDLREAGVYTLIDLSNVSFVYQGWNADLLLMR